ncbi:hypothetical protein ACFL6W_00225 [Thermodesulfobacteriota bacterium]
MSKKPKLSIYNAADSLFKKIAYQWNKYNLPPYRPVEEDIRIMEKAVAKWGNRCPDQKYRALLWGVTPEIADMSWPDGTELLAVDRSEDMISEVWPGDIDGFRKACCCNWLHASSVIKNPVSIVIGDGCFNSNKYPDEWRALFVATHRVLKERGVFIMRFILGSENRESTGNVFKELMENRIGSFHMFKLRLAISMQEDVQKGARQHNMWQTWKDASIDKAELMKITGWTKEAINTIDNWEGLDGRFWSPTHRELKQVFSDIFKEIDITFPKYEMGEYCPTLVFEKKA